MNYLKIIALGLVIVILTGVFYTMIIKFGDLVTEFNGWLWGSGGDGGLGTAAIDEFKDLKLNLHLDVILAGILAFITIKLLVFILNRLL